MLKRNCLYYFPLGICLVVGLAIATFVVQHAASVFDEGDYPYGGWTMLTKGRQPFVDLHMKTLPLLYLLYGLPQAIGGPDFLLARYTAVFFTLLTLLLACLTARRLAGPWAVLLVLAQFVFSLEAAVRYYRALAIAPTAFFYMLALYGLTSSQPRFWHNMLASIAAAGIVLCRFDLLPIALVLWGYAWLRQRRFSFPSAFLAAGAGIFFFLAVCLYFYWQAPVHFVRTLLYGMMHPEAVVGGPYAKDPGAMFSPQKLAWELMMFLRAYTAPLLLMGPALGLFVWRLVTDRKEWGALCQRQQGLLLFLGSAAANFTARLAAIIGFHFSLHYLMDFYIFFPLVVTAAVVFVRMAQRYNSKEAFAQYAACAVLIIGVQLWANGLPGQLQSPGNIAPRIQRGAAAIQEIVPAEELIFSLDDPHQFLQAGRLLHPLLTFQLYHYVDTQDTAMLRSKTHYYNKEILQELLSQLNYAVMSEETWRWMEHSGRYAQGTALRQFLTKQLEQNFMLVRIVPDSYAGPTYIYKRKSGAAPMLQEAKQQPKS